MKSKSFFMSARTQFDNLGDALINQVLFSVLRDKGALHLDCVDVPEDYCQIADIKNNERYFSTLKFYISLFLTRLKGHDVTYFLKPGHIFSTHDTIKTIIRDCVQVFLFMIFHLCGIKIKRVGASIGPFSKISLILEKAKSYFCTAICYRDEYSHDYVKKHQFYNTHCCPDLLFYPEHQPFSAHNKATKPLIAFSFRSAPLKNGNDETYMQSIRQFMTELMQNSDYDFIAISQVTRDQAFQSELVRNASSNIKHIIYDKTPQSYDAIIAAYQKADFVISNRLHGLLNGAIYGAKPIAYVTNENTKVIGVLKSAGLGDSILNAGDSHNITKLSTIISRDPNTDNKGLNEIRALLNNTLERVILL